MYNNDSQKEMIVDPKVKYSKLTPKLYPLPQKANVEVTHIMRYRGNT
jgi:hypothetical protein